MGFDVEIDPEVADILRETAAADLPDPTTLPIAAARAQLTAGSPAWNVDLPALPLVEDLEATTSRGSYRLGTAEMGWFWRNYLGDAPAGDPLAEPMYAELDGLPPPYLTLAEADPLADDTRELSARLTAAGGAHEGREYRGVVHGFMQMTARSAAARAPTVDAGQAIQRLLGAEPRAPATR